MHNHLKSVFAVFWTAFLQAVLSTTIVVLKKILVFFSFFSSQNTVFMYLEEILGHLCGNRHTFILQVFYFFFITLFYSF